MFQDWESWEGLDTQQRGWLKEYNTKTSGGGRSGTSGEESFDKDTTWLS